MSYSYAQSSRCARFVMGSRDQQRWCSVTRSTTSYVAASLAADVKEKNAVVESPINAKKQYKGRRTGMILVCYQCNEYIEERKPWLYARRASTQDHDWSHTLVLATKPIERDVDLPKEVSVTTEIRLKNLEEQLEQQARNINGILAKLGDLEKFIMTTNLPSDEILAPGLSQQAGEVGEKLEEEEAEEEEEI
ncbi:hypothetical protein VNI00_015353 [Paramarasmius palmivorus]|uniref:Uncharacterized protein n=1 Tax=Paramarasmius palmivorus TaxID=297713 RepID=A0AAW0BM32_9AGAR